MPDPAVLAWADGQRRDRIYATSVSEAEMHFGVRVLPEGRRRKDLERVVCALFDTPLGGRVSPFDRAAAECFGGLASARRRLGRPVGMADLQIAAIAQARKASVIVMRNTADFADCATPLTNPWNS